MLPAVQCSFAGTPTRLLSWLQCPRQYRLRYVDRPSPPAGPSSAHASFGASVHAALAHWWRLAPRERTDAMAGQLVDAHWQSAGYRDQQQEDRFRGRARDMVGGYLVRVDPRREPVGIERMVGLRTHGVALYGRVDRIDRRGDELVVIDYKTGRQPPDEAAVRGSLQLAVYVAAVQATLGARCVRAELHHLPSARVARTDFAAGTLARQLDRAARLAREAVAAERALTAGVTGGDPFPPRTGAWCGWCPFLQHCPTGQAVAVGYPPWAGLPGEWAA
jgi:RecB family exonuclease